MTITTRGGMQTINPPMTSSVEDEVRRNYEVVEDSGELVEKSWKKAEIPQKVTTVPRSPPPFPQTLVKKTDDGK